MGLKNTPQNQQKTPNLPNKKNQNQIQTNTTQTNENNNNKKLVHFPSFISKPKAFYFSFGSFHCCCTLCWARERHGACTNSCQLAATQTDLGIAFWGFHHVLFQPCRGKNKELENKIRRNCPIQQPLPSAVPGTPIC